MKLSLFGLGKAGLPFATLIANAGIEVIGVDTDSSLVSSINAGECPLPEEPGLDALMRRMVQQGRLKATTDGPLAVKDASVHIVLVPLFVKKDNSPDFSIVQSVLEVIGKNLKKKDLVVIETTLPMGSMQGIIRESLEEASGMKVSNDFYLAYSPERTMTGYALSRYREFPKIIAGIDMESTKVALGVYGRFSNVRAVTSTAVAEMVKVSEGIFRDVNVALANELYKVAKIAGVNFWEMREAANHQFCNIHEAGNGTGGHCIPIYPWFLIKQQDVPLTKLARNINDGMASYIADMVIEKLKLRKTSKEGAKVAVLGLTYRAHVKATYNSRASQLIAELKTRKIEVYGHDFLLSEEEVKNQFGIMAIDDFSDMDVIIVHNKNPEYRSSLLPIRERVIDTKNVLGNNGA